MKNLWIFLLFAMLVISCSKKNAAAVTESLPEDLRAPYDTTAIDSFSPGAVPRSVLITDSLKKRRAADQLKKDTVSKSR